MRDIPYQLNGIVDDLFGVVDALELGGLVEIDQVFVQVQAGCCQQGPASSCRSARSAAVPLPANG